MKSRMTLLLLAASPVFLSQTTQAVPSSFSPEKETLEISSFLKPIPNSKWNEIAGIRSNEVYEVVAGDTLYAISGRLFGDPQYWPKIWALNNGKITNPHLIRPGKKIHFAPGSGSTLPGLSMDGEITEGHDAEQRDLAEGAPVAGEDTGGGITLASNIYTDLNQTNSGARSQEWKKINTKRWETYNLVKEPEIDPDGFDRRSMVSRRPVTTGMALAALPSEKKIEEIGKIVGAKSDAHTLTTGDLIYIEALEGQGLQVGTEYSVVRPPHDLYSPESGRETYLYTVAGEVKILGVKDGLFLAQMENTRTPVPRGSLVIPKVPRVPTLSPIPGPSGMKAHLLIGPHDSTSATAQFKTAFIDRGSEDGVQPGMVFRAYHHNDPVTGEKLTESNYVIDADFMVLRVSEHFSVAMITRSEGTLENLRPLTLLTDVSSLSGRQQATDKKLGAFPSVDTLDELEKVDRSGGIGVEEEKELFQLENWTEGAPSSDDLDDLDAALEGADDLDGFDGFEGFEGFETGNTLPLPPPPTAPEASISSPDGFEDGFENDGFEEGAEGLEDWEDLESIDTSSSGSSDLDQAFESIGGEPESLDFNVDPPLEEAPADTATAPEPTPEEFDDLGSFDSLPPL